MLFLSHSACSRFSLSNFFFILTSSLAHQPIPSIPIILIMPASQHLLLFFACRACPARPVGPEDRTGVGPEDRTGVAPEDGTWGCSTGVSSLFRSLFPSSSPDKTETNKAMDVPQNVVSPSDLP